MANDEGDDATPEPVLLEDSDSRWGPPGRLTEAPVDPALRLLPTHEMEWPDFERLLLRVAREVRGLRSVSLFGVGGQAQFGLDVIGFDADAEVEAVQGKKYQTFAVADLEAAIAKFLKETRPFPVKRLFIGVGCQANERKVVEAVVAYNRDLRPLEIELWDRSRLSELLRSRPDIVREFFGTATATSFCGPFVTTVPLVPGEDAVAFADAVSTGPAAGGPAGEALRLAASERVTDPVAALEHTRDAQRLLTDAGFPAHASALDRDVCDLLVEVGQRDAAARVLLDGVWEALRTDRAVDAQVAAHELGLMLEEDGVEASAVVRTAAMVAGAAVGLYLHPLGLLADPSALANVANGADVDRARLLLLAGEIALADGAYGWLLEAQSLLAEMATLVAVPAPEVALRLRLLVAEASGGWGSLVGEARRRAPGRSLSALVLARHARFLVLHGDFAGADAEWTEAVEQGCLARMHEDAASWLWAQRGLAMRVRPVASDVWHPIAIALLALPGSPPVVSVRGIRERALSALQQGEKREAVLRLRRHLRDEVASGCWQGERDARVLLGSVYAQVGEVSAATAQFVAAGAAKEAEELARAVEDYVDVREHLGAPTYWTAATAFRVLAAQADLVPDEQVDEIAQHALKVLDAAAEGTLLDTPLFSPSVFLSAHAALGALAERLSEERAVRLLSLLEPLTDAPEGHYRPTDEDHARAAAGIASSHPTLRDAAFGQMLRLLSRDPHALRGYPREVMLEHLSLVRDGLIQLAKAGSSTAEEMLSYAEPEKISDEAAHAAGEQLRAALLSGPGRVSVGTNAVAMSLSACALPADERVELIRVQLSRARSPYEPSGNRSQYLLAAANLSEDLTEEQVAELFPLAMQEAISPAESEADELASAFSHRLGALQFQASDGSRPEGTFLAGRLARTPGQRDQVRRAALALLGDGDQSDFYAVKVLQILQDDLGRDMPYLARQGWAPRSLAGIVWATTADADPRVGQALAQDPDPRVRRDLATALEGTPESPRTDAVRAALRRDVRYSVRRRIA